MAIKRGILIRESLMFAACLVIGFFLTPLLFFRPASAREDVPKAPPWELNLTPNPNPNIFEGIDSTGWHDAAWKRVLGTFRAEYPFNNQVPDSILARLIVQKWPDYKGALEDVPHAEHSDISPEASQNVRERSAWSQFIAHLFSPYYFLETWASILLFYLAFQVLRSLYWAVHALVYRR